jgi:hypothetical protein
MFLGFRAKDAEDAKVRLCFLESEFFKFIYKSLNVAFKDFSAKVNQ